MTEERLAAIEAMARDDYEIAGGSAKELIAEVRRLRAALEMIRDEVSIDEADVACRYADRALRGLPVADCFAPIEDPERRQWWARCKRPVGHPGDHSHVADD